MSYSYIRRLTTHLSANILRFNSYNKSLISFKTIRRLNTFDCHVFRSQNLMKCLSENKCQSIRPISTSQEINLFSDKLRDNFVDQKRYKKGKKGSKREAKDESSDEESDAEAEPVDEFDPDLIDGKAIDFIDTNVTLVSLRLDNVAKSGLSLARNKVDEAFYKNMIRVNGERVSKKSAELSEGDEVDLIIGLNQDNQDLIDVNRVVIKKIEDKLSHKDRVRAKLRRFRNLTIENYANDPYDGFNINMKREVKEEDKQ